MRLNWFFPRLAMLAFVMLLGTGCSGINTGTSVSPASFFLPGIMKADPPAVNPSPMAAVVPFNQLALAR